MPIKLGIGLGILLLLMVSSFLNSMVTANFARNQAVSRVYCELESVQRAIDPVNGSRAGLFNSFDALSIALLEYSNYDKRLTLDRFEIVHMLSNGIATDAESFTELEQRRLVTVRNAIFKFQSSLRVHMALIPNTNGPNYYSKQLSTEYFSACYQIFVLDLTRTTDGFPSA